jgi:hypothetical protein
MAHAIWRACFDREKFELGALDFVKSRRRLKGSETVNSRWKGAGCVDPMSGQTWGMPDLGIPARGQLVFAFGGSGSGVISSMRHTGVSCESGPSNSTNVGASLLTIHI